MIIRSIKKVLNPNFLQRIDEEYLLNNPRLWTLKIHYLCYYVGIVNLLLLIVLCFYRFELYHTTTLIQVGQVFFAINSIAIIGWVILQFYYNVAYNPEKQFGEVDFKKGWLVDFFGYLLCLIILICPIVIFSTITQFKMENYAIDKDQFISEYVILNLLNNEDIRISPSEDYSIFDYYSSFFNHFDLNSIAEIQQENRIKTFFLSEHYDLTCDKNNVENCKILFFIIKSPS